MTLATNVKRPSAISQRRRVRLVTLWKSIAIVSRGDWLGKPANIKVENNGAEVYVGSLLTVHNPLFFVYKL